MTAEASLAEGEKTAGEGVEWLENKPYDNSDGTMPASPITGVLPPRGKGQYTLKKLHFKSKIPGLLAALAPSSSLFLIEEAWNAYPHCKTVLVSGYLSPKTLRIDVETMHVGGAGCLDVPNAVGLSPEELKARHVEYLSILDPCKDPAHKDYDAALDLTQWRSAVTGRGPLAPGWEKALALALAAAPPAGGAAEGGAGGGAEGGAGGAAQAGPALMVAYKCVRIDTSLFGLGGTVQSAVLNSQRGLFARSLCQATATLDKWHACTWEDIRALEARVAQASNSKLAQAGGGGAAEGKK